MHPGRRLRRLTATMLTLLLVAIGVDRSSDRAAGDLQSAAAAQAPSGVILGTERGARPDAGLDLPQSGAPSTPAAPRRRIADALIDACRMLPTAEVMPELCELGDAYRFHAGNTDFFHRGPSYPISVSDNTVTVELDVRAGQAEFELISAWIKDYWEGGYSFLGQPYAIEVNLTLLDNPFARAHVEIRHVRAIDGGWCGDWSPSGGVNADTVLRVAWGGSCFDVQAVAAAHEFGHELGFRDAYDQATCDPLHNQVNDVMTCAGVGRSVLGAHARILVEQYADQ